MKKRIKSPVQQLFDDIWKAAPLAKNKEMYVTEKQYQSLLKYLNYKQDTKFSINGAEIVVKNLTGMF